MSTPDTTDPTHDGPSVDVVEFRLEQAQKALTARVPALFADATADHPGVAGWVTRYLADPATSPSLVLTGRTGTGKSHQCWGLVRRVVEARAAVGRGLVWKVASHPQLNDELRPKPDGSHAWALNAYLDADLLVLDDLGAGVQSAWTGDSLHRLTDHRWSHRLPTVYSTNLLSQQLIEAVGDRVVSRLADAVHVVVKGEDRRWGGAR